MKSEIGKLIGEIQPSPARASDKVVTDLDHPLVLVIG